MSFVYLIMYFSVISWLFVVWYMSMFVMVVLVIIRRKFVSYILFSDVDVSVMGWFYCDVFSNVYGLFSDC